MSASYSLACIPTPYQVLGLKLKPLSLGHCILMQRFGCVFMSDEPARANLGDLVLSVAICSMTYEGFLEFIATPDWRQEVREWSNRIGYFDIPARMILFCEYLRKGMEEPEVFFEGDGNASGAHWTQSLKVALLELGYTPSEAMNIPLTQAFADFFKAAENRGAVTIADPNWENNCPPSPRPSPPGEGEETEAR